MPKVQPASWGPQPSMHRHVQLEGVVQVVGPVQSHKLQGAELKRGWSECGWVGGWVEAGWWLGWEAHRRLQRWQGSCI